MMQHRQPSSPPPFRSYTAVLWVMLAKCLVASAFTAHGPFPSLNLRLRMSSSSTQEDEVVHAKSTQEDEEVAVQATSTKDVQATSTQEDDEVQQAISTQEDDELQGTSGILAVPMAPKDGYPCLRVSFPDVDPDAEYDFLLDTGSNAVNLHAGVVEDKNLPVAMSGEGLISRIGGKLFHPGDIYAVGDCYLTGLPEQYKLMPETWATGFACPEHAVWEGRFGVPFLDCYPGGVSFQWHGTESNPPTVVFFSDLNPPDTSGMKVVPLVRLPTDILSIPVTVNKETIYAVLDTGSDKTILTPEAAEHMEIATENVDDEDEMAISNLPVSVQVGDVSLGQGHVHVREMPKLLGLVGEIAEQGFDPLHMPSAILGLDFLRKTSHMIVRVAAGEVWFEELLLSNNTLAEDYSAESQGPREDLRNDTLADDLAEDQGPREEPRNSTLADDLAEQQGPREELRNSTLPDDLAEDQLQSAELGNDTLPDDLAEDQGPGDEV